MRHASLLLSFVLGLALVGGSAAATSSFRAEETATLVLLRGLAFAEKASLAPGEYRVGVADSHLVFIDPRSDREVLRLPAKHLPAPQRATLPRIDKQVKEQRMTLLFTQGRHRYQVRGTIQGDTTTLLHLEEKRESTVAAPATAEEPSPQELIRTAVQVHRGQIEHCEQLATRRTPLRPDPTTAAACLCHELRNWTLPHTTERVEVVYPVVGGRLDWKFVVEGEKVGECRVGEVPAGE